ncbi:unnamed protein product [Sphagnum troendelagicum]|uniref:Protein kinase domain-containing protein n=1 Tax=Sphagnum troendelagicum TaxID=128251 RepID=A0ABP0TBZ5_9BRYO
MSMPLEDSTNRRVKFMCSFGGKILPRPGDGRLRYVGGETRIINVNRDISYTELMFKVTEIYGHALTLKYQLPDEELDALVSVSSDEDLENMMEEYDKLEGSDGFSRLRIFLFPAVEYDVTHLSDSMGDQRNPDQRYVDAVNGVPETGSRKHSEVGGVGHNPVENHMQEDAFSMPFVSQSIAQTIPPPIGSDPSSPRISFQESGRYPGGYQQSQVHRGYNGADYVEQLHSGVLYHPIDPPSRPFHPSPQFGDHLVHPEERLLRPLQQPAHVSSERLQHEQRLYELNTLSQSQISDPVTRSPIPHYVGSNPFQEGLPVYEEYQDAVHKQQYQMDGNQALYTEQQRHFHPQQSSSRLEYQNQVLHPVEKPIHSQYQNQLEKGTDWGLQQQQGHDMDGAQVRVVGRGRSQLDHLEEDTLADIRGTCALEAPSRSYPRLPEDADALIAASPGESFQHRKVDWVEPSGNRNFHSRPCIPQSNVLSGYPPALEQLQSVVMGVQSCGMFESSGQLQSGVMGGQAKPSVNNIIDMEQEPMKGIQVSSNGVQRKGGLSDDDVMLTLYGLQNLLLDDRPPLKGQKPLPTREMQSMLPPTSKMISNVEQTPSIQEFTAATTLTEEMPPSCLYPTNMMSLLSSDLSASGHLASDMASALGSESATLIEQMKNDTREDGKGTWMHTFQAPLMSSPTFGFKSWEENLANIETDFDKVPTQQSLADEKVTPDAKSEKIEVKDQQFLVDALNENQNHGPVNLLQEELKKESYFCNTASDAEAEAVSRGLQTIKDADLEEMRELGSGTFGTVYHGKWRGTDVAIKRIRASCFAGQPSEQERLTADFWKEASILSQLHHPNVVAFYGVVRDGPGGTLATVTEYMVNGSLKQVLQKRDRTIDRRKRLLIATDAAFGMEYLHSKNIVHFDLKCENLLVNMRDPHRPICKVGDLGLSKVKHQTMVSGGVRGTLPWMAPELLNGTSTMVTEKVDVFSFGIVMWELLTGEEPYANLHYGAIIGGIVNNTLRPEVPTWCDPTWKLLMERCWASEPVERPGFSEIASDLRTMAVATHPKAQGQFHIPPPETSSR